MISDSKITAYQRSVTIVLPHLPELKDLFKRRGKMTTFKSFLLCFKSWKECYGGEPNEYGSRNVFSYKELYGKIYLPSHFVNDIAIEVDVDGNDIGE